jgi:DNA-binding response OmpR family regulator
MKKILIIEDDRLVANVYRNKFAVDHYEAEIAGDGESGIEMVGKMRPDLVLLDLMLPKMSGVDVLKRIRANSDMKQLPVIVFSNTYLTHIVQEAWKAGATKCLSKANCTPKQVLEVVHSLLPPTLGPGAPATSTKRVASPGAALAHEISDTSDAAFQADLHRTFVESLPSTLVALRTTLQALSKSPDEADRIRQIQELYRRIHALTGNAGIAEAVPIAQMADALEALLKELYEKPKNINASTLRTVASAVDFLGTLFAPENLPAPQASQRPLQGSVLVVDDEAISQRAIVYALEKAKLQAVKIDDPAAALELMGGKNFDLIFLDVDMPVMNGFELCTKLRCMHLHKKTPVVFVTSLTDFESRANSTISGGNDLIAKPFVFMELAVKALVYVMRGKLVNRAAAAARAM